MVAATGCEDKRRHQVSEEVEFKIVPPSSGKDATPEQIAREALEAMRDFQHVRREGLGKGDNRRKYENAMGRLLGIAARDQIYQDVKPRRVQTTLSDGRVVDATDGSPFMPWDVTEDAAVRKIVETWTSKLAHYIDGLDFDTMKLAKSGEKESTVTVFAENARERELLQTIEKEVASLKENGAPIERGSKPYWDEVRRRTLEKGFNVPIGVQIKLTLLRLGDGWRVHLVDIGPVP